ncbi:fasciclin domain protein [Dichotomopilus funicola]|uniref:Fasciclin domain protein n=1 Tax=Dichotomopilus funicola TaxID=1934379 RepID=A0AAN6ZPR7_9PEZI|nr:fasciclin domain protein [Dichotomopilus funicola]
MRRSILLFAATAAALVTPNEPGKQQVALSENHQHEKATNDHHNVIQAWWDALPDGGKLLSPLEDRISKSEEHGNTFDRFMSRVNSLVDEADFFPPRPPHHPHPPGGGHGHHGHHGDPEKTLYELIKESKHTTKFAKLIEEHDEIKQLLQDTEHNYTVFVPTDRAFKHLPHHGKHGKHGDDGDDDDKHHHHKPSKEFITALLKYHIVPGLFSSHRIHATGTIPTTLHITSLEPSSLSPSSSQRIRAFTTPLIHFTRLNFFTRLGPTDFLASNGLLHAIDTLLIPPPSQTDIIRLLPSQFSTLGLALESTGLGEELASLPRSGGGTFFAPTNAAWNKLGPRANAFLFSERGRGYLKALVKYHVVVNETLYSDAFYRGDGGKHGEGEDENEGGSDKVSLGGGRRGGRHHGGGQDRYRHVDLPSLLDGKPISVDVKRWKGFVSIVANGFSKVQVRDAVADDGVLQVVGNVLIPPHGHDHGGHEGSEDAEVSVEELKSRLGPYLEEEDEEKTDGRQEELGDL